MEIIFSYYTKPFSILPIYAIFQAVHSPHKESDCPPISHTSPFVFSFKILINFLLLEIIFTVFQAFFPSFFTKTMFLESTENIWRGNGHSKKKMMNNLPHSPILFSLSTLNRLSPESPFQ